MLRGGDRGGGAGPARGQRLVPAPHPVPAPPVVVSRRVLQVLHVVAAVVGADAEQPSLPAAAVASHRECMSYNPTNIASVNLVMGCSKVIFPLF